MTLFYSTSTCDIAMKLLHSAPTGGIAMTLNGMTPLMWAAVGGHLEVVMYLVTHGSQLEAKDWLIGKTPLMTAAVWGHLEVVMYLITQGSQLDATSRVGYTALHYAARNRWIDVTKWLIDQGCSPWMKTKQGETPCDVVTMERCDDSEEKKKKKEVMDFLKTVMLKTPEGSYNAMDVVYNKVLMTSRDEKETNSSEKLDQHQASDISPAGSKYDDMGNPGVLQQSQAMALPLPSNTSDTISNQPPSAIPLSPETSSIVPLSRQQLKQKMKAKMTIDEIRRKMEKVLKSGKYKMKVGRLIFWDFGGQYVYYTTHQTFMTYRALFLVVFDGSKGLHEQVPDVLCFPGQHMTPTPAVFLQHWVNCILTYCKVVYTGIPKILFVATHKDKVPKEDIETRRAELYSGVEELFKDHEGRGHLVIDNQIFVNATDKTDPEIDVLKKAITDLTFQHPCWGESMPNASVPLELEIANLVVKGKQVLSLREVEELNSISKVSVLSNEELRDFLQFHHSLGKLVYFDTPQLKGYVIISPLLLVEVMRSFVTDIAFWPKKGLIRNTFEKMSGSGIIQRKDLYLIWEQKHFNKISPYKEFIFDMLIHLDILSEQRRYDTNTGSRLPVENFFVPCMLTQRNDTRFMTHECTPEKAISLAFVFKGTIIPPALPNRLISACLSMWTVKTYEGKQLLFSGFIGLSFDKAHTIVVCVEGNKIFLYIVHDTSNGLIVPDIATGIKECMFTTLERISEFYKSTVQATSISQKLPFHIEYACSRLECHIPEEAAFTTDEWICHKHTIVHTKDKWNIWNQDQEKEQCEEDCPGLHEDALIQIPSDIELQRFSSRFDETTIRELAIHLGMALQEWDDLKSNNPRCVQIVKYRILVNWRENCSGTFKNMWNALTKMELTTHMLCQVKRTRNRQCDFNDEYLDLIPTDEILDKLAQVIGEVSFPLGIELGLPVTSLDIIQYKNGLNLVAECKEILFQWREDQKVKPTISVLVQALVNVGRGARCLEEIIKTVGVKEYIPLEEVEEEKQGKFKTFLQKLNPFQ
ncbi:uncharacterized protein LOC134699512 [Mytilus trossulus]|uniref:uncharacterized protein LOC134699512 n=1 Tax=Mytilus trossulus TaxID=6551 RepID=UPI0030049763